MEHASDDVEDAANVTAMIERHYGELVEGFDREIADRLSAARNKSRRSPDLASVSSLTAARRSRRRTPAGGSADSTTRAEY
jgi:hypothetical protein